MINLSPQCLPSEDVDAISHREMAKLLLHGCDSFYVGKLSFTFRQKMKQDPTFFRQKEADLWPEFFYNNTLTLSEKEKILAIWKNEYKKALEMTTFSPIGHPIIRCPDSIIEKVPVEGSIHAFVDIHHVLKELSVGRLEHLRSKYTSEIKIYNWFLNKKDANV